MSKQYYDPANDPAFREPVIVEEGWKEKPVRHYYVHGYFKGTEVKDIPVWFAFYYPEKEKYDGRFYQFITPTPEDERTFETVEGEENRVVFSVTHGAYFVMSNQGGVIGDNMRIVQANANSAELSRKYAKALYGEDIPRPYGYIFGGSGGSLKTFSCIEGTRGVWDGSVPYVIVNPMAMPNIYSPRVRVMRILGDEGVAKVVDSMEAGGSGDIYAGLNEEQREALEEATRMGFPKRAWFLYPKMGDGALMVLMPYVYFLYPQYFKDFWTVPGFAGADPNSSESKARVQFVTTVKRLIVHEQVQGDFHSADTSWRNVANEHNATPDVELEALPPEGSYLVHACLRVLSGAAAGSETAIGEIKDGVVIVDTSLREGNVLEGLAVGDTVMVDNSDYLAMQTLPRYQVPDASYHTYDQYRNADGTCKYPQLPMLISLEMNGKDIMDADYDGKMIAVCSLCDDSAFPWHGDWYRRRVEATRGEAAAQDSFRLYYNDHAIHDDGHWLEDRQNYNSYMGSVYQALLDVSRWAEKGIAPVASTNYVYNDGQIEVPETAEERGGYQPVVASLVNGAKRAVVKVGEEVTFTATIETPPQAGTITGYAWDFEKTGQYDYVMPENISQDGTKATVSASHVFTRPGTYFPCIKVTSERNGNAGDIFTQQRNLDHVRVIVEA